MANFSAIYLLPDRWIPYNVYKCKVIHPIMELGEFQYIVTQGSCLTFSLAGQSGQPKSTLAGPQSVSLARDTIIGFGEPIIITILINRN